MALEEGVMGKAEAIEAARSAGVLGGESLGTGYGTLGHGTGTGAGYGIGGGRGGGVAARGWAPVVPSRYAHTEPNGWITTAKDHLSTFAADVDTASYTQVRRSLLSGTTPPADAVRVEEMINYFRYAYPAPSGSPFSVTTDLAPSPFDPERHILRVGVSTNAPIASERAPAHLVFLVDVSGSMRGADRLPLAKRALRILVDSLQPGDTVALVTYAGTTRVVLPATSVSERATIVSAIEDLTARGSTAMADGLTLAYREAAKGVKKGAVSRVIVLSDGDANVGETDDKAMLATIAAQVKKGVTLSTIGFGVGNYRDQLMEQLSNKGNGNNYYVDTISEAKRIFAEQVGATLQVVAKDVKLQIEFSPERVKRYRLVGYENRDIKDRDFRNDRVDAGEIGAGHQVTAIYEVELTAADAPLGTLRVRHKAPQGRTASEAAFAISGASAAQFASAQADLRFAFAVAAFADVMRGAKEAEGWELPQIRALAAAATTGDKERGAFVQVIDRAIALRGKVAIKS